jgi:tRNA C32,U32 (ribose-2'-O)-methylase TrmJ
MNGVLLEALRASGYEVGSAAGTERKVRRLLRRLSLQTADVDLCLGMLRQIIWKLRQGEKAASRS